MARGLLGHNDLMSRRFGWLVGLLLAAGVTGCSDQPRPSASSSDEDEDERTAGPRHVERPLELRLRFEAVGLPSKIATPVDVLVDKSALALALDAARPPLVACYAGRPLSKERSEDRAATWITMRIDATGAPAGAATLRSNAPDESGACARDVLGKLAFGVRPQPSALSVWIEVFPKDAEPIASAPSAEPLRSSAPSKASARSRLPAGSCDSDNVLAYLPICADGPGGKWADPLRDGFGTGGLGLSGVGEGSPTPGDTGLGAVGTPNGQGFGGGGRLGGTHRSKPPQVRMGGTTVSGRLPAEVIQRIVRQRFGQFRLCYENALRSDPMLEGRVTVSFTIVADGSVSGLTHTSTIADRTVGECVEKAFASISFPQPESGVVKVTYPIAFAPGDTPPKKVSSILGIDLGKLTGAALATAATRDNVVATSVDGDPSGDVPFVVFVDTGGEHFAVLRTPRPGEQPRSRIALLGDDFMIHVIASGNAKPTTKFLE